MVNDNSLSKTAEQLQRHYKTLITGDVHPVNHPVEKGDAREHGWRELFRRFLPNRYGVKSGFIIDSEGKLSEQIDCIIYRRDSAIELYAVGHHTVIPIESVFGAFEIKPSINNHNIKYAEKKASSVLKLKISNFLDEDKKNTKKIELKTDVAYGTLIFGLLADSMEAKSKWRTPAFKKQLKTPDAQVGLFMTVKDGCVDTLETGYPTEEYTFDDSPHALFNQLIRLSESFIKLEKKRCMSSCFLSKYKNELDKPKIIKI